MIRPLYATLAYALGLLLGALLGSATANAQVQSGHAVTSVLAAADDNSTLLKASAAAVMEVQACSTVASIRYVKLYSKATAPTCGTDTPKMRVMVPASGCATFASEQGVSFPAGLGFCIVAGAADNDTTAPSASDVTLNIGWR